MPLHTGIRTIKQTHTHTHAHAHTHTHTHTHTHAHNFVLVSHKKSIIIKAFSQTKYEPHSGNQLSNCIQNNTAISVAIDTWRCGVCDWLFLYKWNTCTSHIELYILFNVCIVSLQPAYTTWSEQEAASEVSPDSVMLLSTSNQIKTYLYSPFYTQACHRLYICL